MRRSVGPVSVVLAAVFVSGPGVGAQDRLRLMPGSDQYARMQPQLGFVSGAATSVQWAADSASFTYSARGQRRRFDVAALRSAEAPVEAAAGVRGGGGRAAAPPPPRGGLEQAQGEMPATPMDGCPQTGPARGRQEACVLSPDGRRKAFYRARNFFVANTDGSGEFQVTTDGSVAARIKYGSASWVYGEELDQTSAIWWSPDSSKVGYYRFDESQVLDFYVAMNQTATQTEVDVEAYPKAGTPNPIADVFVFDVGRRRATRLDVRDGRPFSNDVVGHYVYNVRWAPDGSELLMNRTNRRQQILEFVACSPASARCRVLVRDESTTGWIENNPEVVWLADGKRFLWESERNGWTNYYLYDMSGRLLAPVTAHTTFEAGAPIKVDESAGVFFYMARDGDNALKLQLHRVGLDGRGDVRLTDPAFTHSVTACVRDGVAVTAGSAPCGISPDSRHFVDTYQAHDRAPATQVVEIAAGAGGGRAVAQLTASDVSALDALGLRRVEQFSYLAADGKTRLFGQVAFPSNFDESRAWPVLVNVYAGPVPPNLVPPENPSENFVAPRPLAEYGFLVVNLSSRASPGVGRRALDAIYMKLGVADVDDVAEGIRSLASRSYVDRDRIGIYGTSYGGYVAATMILRHPDLVAAASAASPVTSWHQYDSIYTERYMWTPQENAAGYEAGSDMTYASALRGRLLLYYGTADNNVHPNNSLQLIRALQSAGKSFELQVGPDAGHSAVNQSRMMEFFIENLVLRPERARGR